MNSCAVTADLNRYLDSFDKEDQYKSFIDKRVEELTSPATALYPFSIQNFCEALSESDLSDVAWTCQNGLTTIAGLKLQKIVIDYWHELARKQAETEAETNCSKCFGDGCPSCFE